MELFDHIQKSWKPPQEWDDVHFEYLYMNFVNGLYLDDYDCELSPTVIFGLRVAYVFFMEKIITSHFKYSDLKFLHTAMIFSFLSPSLIIAMNL